MVLREWKSLGAVEYRHVCMALVVDVLGVGLFEDGRGVCWMVDVLVMSFLVVVESSELK